MFKATRLRRRSSLASNYVRPVAGMFKRQDQGADIQGKPGDNVVAMGLARIDAVKDDPGGFGKAIYYTLLDGPLRGQQIYVGHTQPLVGPGRIVQAGQPVSTLLQHGLGNAADLSGWVEIGFAKNGVPQPGSSGRFKALLDKSSATPIAPPPAPVSSQPDLSAYDTTAVTPSAPVQPEDTQPLLEGGIQSEPASLWQRVVQGSTSPDPMTLQYANLAGG